MNNEQHMRKSVPVTPKGRERIKWYGPGLLWMLSAVGTGSILFTPRIASIYSYKLLWLLLIVVFFMFVMIKEMARFSIVTGCTILDGLHRLRGPKNWAVWIIFIPQLFAAAIGIAGLSAIVGSALSVYLPGNDTLYGILTILICTTLTTTGKYMSIESISRIMALLLMAFAVASAFAVFPGLQKVGTGLLFQWPDKTNLYIILPWVGTILAGSMGIIWFSYWTATRGYGGGLEGTEKDDEMSDELHEEQKKSRSDSHTKELIVYRLEDWLRVMKGAALLGVVGGSIVIISFLILGSELLAPAGLLPQGADVAVDLSKLFSKVWGDAGKILLLIAIVIALGGSVLANQDGWGRSFADITLILLRGKRTSKDKGFIVNSINWLNQKFSISMFERHNMKKIFIVVITGIIPVMIIIMFQDPVAVMSASGIIAAVHTPFIIVTAFLVNLFQLPDELKPGFFSSISMVMAALFYLSFAAVYFLDFFGVM